MLVVAGVSMGLASFGTSSSIAHAAPAPQSSSAVAGMVGLQQGSRGDAVRSLQQALVSAGVAVSGGVDGIFGVGTAAAVKQFQSARGLGATGVVDQATASALAGTGGGASASPLFGLKIGASGDAVRQLQATLVALGYKTKGDADGFFGVNTVNALTQFQYAQRIKVTAKVDEATLAALGTPATVPAAAAPAAVQPSNPLFGLKIGARGEAVRQLQATLLAHGYKSTGDADGAFGVNTVNALTQFQYAKRIKVTAKVDEATLAALGTPVAVPAAAQPAPAASSAGVVGFAAYGERGARVTTLQRALINAGVAVRGGADGIFGSGTAAAVTTFQKAKGLPATGVVDQATAEALALTPVSAPAVEAAPSIALQAFPVQGKCFYGDSWHVPRGGGRLHEGTDIGAAEGKYVYAAGDGRITKQYIVGTNQLTGNGLIVRMADGTYFFYGHLMDFAPGIGLGSPVKAGQIIGYVGKTGNSGVPHLHFEVHPKGGAAINPYPLLKAINGCGNTNPPAQP